MGERVCSACGTALPDGAKFCAACGAAVAPGGVPVLDLARDETPHDHPEEPPRDRSLATAAAVVVGLIALVVVLSVFAGGDDDHASPDAPTTSTTGPTRRSTTTLPRPTNSTGPLLGEGEHLDPAFGMALVSIRSNGTVVVADLESGDERVLEERIPLAPVQSMTWVGSTFIGRSVSQDLHRLVPDTTNRWEVVDTFGMAADPYWPGPPGLVYLWDPEQANASGMRFGLVEPTGPLRFLDGPTSVFLGAPIGMVHESAVFNTPDGIYLLGPDQQPRRLGHGHAFGAAADRLVRRECDDHLECRLLLDAPLEGQVTDLGPIDPAAIIQRAVPSPTGDAVALIALVDDELTVRVLPVPAGRTLTWVVGQRWSEPHMLQWAPGGEGLVWFDTERREVRSVRWRDGEPSAAPSVARLEELAPTASFEAVFLIPAGSLPPGWTPSDPAP